jgi:hypothetical protein
MRKTSIGMGIALVVWMAAVSGGTVLLARYSNSPGGSGDAPVSWPKETTIPFDSSQPTLVMFAHPHCPCTRASLGELDRLLLEVSRRCSARVVFLKPAGTARDWEKTDLWRQASSIPGVTVCPDDKGVEARRFHAETSGQTLLYGPDGNLKFQGGITLARGHAGDNAGRTALTELLLEGHSKQFKTAVFGCGLFEAQCQSTNVLCKP